jgi:hypothetical protein
MKTHKKNIKKILKRQERKIKELIFPLEREEFYIQKNLRRKVKLGIEKLKRREHRDSKVQI